MKKSFITSGPGLFSKAEKMSKTFNLQTAFSAEVAIFKNKTKFKTT